MSRRKIGKGLGLIRLVAFPADCLDNEINLLDPNKDRLEYKSPGEKKEPSFVSFYLTVKMYAFTKGNSPASRLLVLKCNVLKIFHIWQNCASNDMFTHRTAFGKKGLE